MFMFVGRERKLEILNDIYHTDGFNMLVVSTIFEYRFIQKWHNIRLALALI